MFKHEPSKLSKRPLLSTILNYKIWSQYFSKNIHNYVRCSGSLLIYLASCLGQETAKWPMRSSSQAATCYYQSNHSKVL